MVDALTAGQVAGKSETWPMEYLLHMNLTRDSWMHRSDIAAGDGGEMIEIDTVEFCPVLSGRGSRSGRLAQEVPF